MTSFHSRSARRQLRCGLALAALATVTAVQPAAAQDQPASSADDQDSEILVTGAKVGVGTSRAGALLDKQDIADRPFGSDITQSLNKVPGIQTTTGDARGGSFSFEFAMRGLSKEQVGFTIDGIPTGDARFNGGSPPQRFIDSSNIDHITVSQSAGDLGAPSRFALGGFIDFATDDPHRERGATLEAGYGSDAFWRGYARIDTGEIASGLTAYASYTHQENDIWTGPKNRHSRRDHAEAKIVKAFDDGSFLKARVSWNDQRDNDFNIITLDQFRADPRADQATDRLTGVPAIDVNYGGALGGTRRDMIAYVNAGWRIGDHALITVNPYYQTLRGESYRYQDRARDLAGDDPYAVTGYNATGGAIRPALTTLRNSSAVGGPADMRVTPRDRDRYGASAELKLDQLFVSNNGFRIGGWWEGGTSTEERRYFRITDPTTSIAYDRSALNYVEYSRWTSIETVMLYAQDQLALVPGLLRLDLGANWLNVHYKARSPLEYSARLDFSQHSALNPKLGFTLTPAPRIEIYGGYAKNFSGIPEDAFLGSTAVITPGSLDPISSENVDLGLRYKTRHFVAVAQVYSVDLKNNIGIVPNDPTVTDPDEIMRGNVATRAANIRGEHTRGIELTGIGNVGIVDLYASYAYQDAHYADAAIGSSERLDLASVGIIAGSRVRDVPRHSAYAEIGLKPFDGLRLQANVRAISDRVGGDIVAATTFKEIGIETIPGYALVGLGGSYTVRDAGPLRGLTFQLNVDNLFDRAYLGSVSSSTATQPEYSLPAHTLTRYFLGAPRTVTASVRLAF